MSRRAFCKESQIYVTRLVPALVMLLIACSVMLGQDVKADYMPGTDFSKYRTYKWVTVEGGQHPDQIIDAQIKQSIRW